MCVLPLEQKLLRSLVSFVGVHLLSSQANLYKTEFCVDEHDPYRRKISWSLRVAALTTVFLLEIKVIFCILSELFCVTL